MAEKNPIFPKWHDPFLGVTREFLAGYGDGDAGKGYNRLLKEEVDEWNKRVDEGMDMPHTSIENGMDWMPSIDKEKHAAARAAFNASRRQ